MVFSQRSQLGTDFDRLAIAIVSPRISNAEITQRQATEVLLKESKKRNGDYHSIEQSVVIENPLADIDDESVPYDE